MALSFIETNIPRAWWGDRPTSITEIRSQLDSAALPTEFIERCFRVLDEVEQLLQPGDELYTFASPSIAWENRMGTGGYVVVRSGAIIYAIMTICN